MPRRKVRSCLDSLSERQVEGRVGLSQVPPTLRGAEPTCKRRELKQPAAHPRPLRQSRHFSIHQRHLCKTRMRRQRARRRRESKGAFLTLSKRRRWCPAPHAGHRQGGSKLLHTASLFAQSRALCLPHLLPYPFLQARHLFSGPPSARWRERKKHLLAFSKKTSNYKLQIIFALNLHTG